MWKEMAMVYFKMPSRYLKRVLAVWEMRERTEFGLFNNKASTADIT
jgi:hypothetical protein